MGFLQKLRDKARLKEKPGKGSSSFDAPRVAVPPGVDYTAALDTDETRNILKLIFAFVCPHAVDDRYLPMEECDADGCMLCDMRDIVQCLQVKRSWFVGAIKLL